MDRGVAGCFVTEWKVGGGRGGLFDGQEGWRVKSASVVGRAGHGGGGVMGNLQYIHILFFLFPLSKYIIVYLSPHCRMCTPKHKNGGYQPLRSPPTCRDPDARTGTACSIISPCSSRELELGCRDEIETWASVRPGRRPPEFFTRPVCEVLARTSAKSGSRRHSGSAANCGV
jgi:hypothetical protein